MITEHEKKDISKVGKNPTMEEITSKAGAAGSESGKNQSLIEQLEDLERQWESINKRKPRSQRTVGRFSTASEDSGSCLTFDHQLLENSPRLLMSSLQHRRSPSDGFLRVKNCDAAVEEILRERRAAIASGKVKGRRLFAEEEVEVDLDYGDCGDWLSGVGERDVVVENGDCGGEVLVSQEKVVVLEEKAVVKAAERGGGGWLRGDGGDRRWIKAMAWLGFVITVLIAGLVVSMSCSGKFVHGDELILVPT